MPLLDKLNKQKSWARWFADGLNLPWENRAQPGSSMAQIIFEIERDIFNNYINDTDLIIVGITSPNRILTFNENGHRTRILNCSAWKNKSFEKEFIKEIANDDYIMYNWIKDIRYLDLLRNKLNGRLLQQWIWATCDEMLEPTGNFQYNNTTPVKNMINFMNNFESIIDETLSFTTINAWAENNRHSLFHPKIEIHKKFGIQLADTFKSKYSFKR